MPLLTTVIDDKSPLITYDATWLPGTSLGGSDDYTVDYYLGTFQKNNESDGTATFSFNGTAFWIYGANRPNHGTYTVQVDGSNYPNQNGSGNNVFQQSLFTTNVDQGALHTVNLINTGGTSGLYVDIDMIVWQSEVGSAGDQLVLETVSDTDFRFQYQQSTWETTSSSSYLNLNLFNNGTGHVTNTSGANVAFAFTVCPPSTEYASVNNLSEAVTLFGTSGPANGQYSVRLDGGNSVTYNATNVYPTHYGVAIYHADNLGPGAHQIVLTNLPAPNGQYFTIDYAQLWTIANSTSIVPPTGTTCAPSNNNSQNTLSSGAIAGLVVEGAIAVLAAAAALFFYRRWKAASEKTHTLYTPLYRPPETTTGTDVAPSLETRSNPNSLQNDNPFQPLAAVGRLNQQLANNGTVQDTPTRVASNSLDARIVTEGATSANQFPNAGQTSRRRRLPDAPGGELPQPEGHSASHRESELPPTYDTAVRG